MPRLSLDYCGPCFYLSVRDIRAEARERCWSAPAVNPRTKRVVPAALDDISPALRVEVLEGLLLEDQLLDLPLAGPGLSLRDHLFVLSGLETRPPGLERS